MSAPKFCKDCRWSKRDWMGERYRQCLSPDRVRHFFGGKTPNYCDIERDEYFAVIGACGESARHFEPRPPSRWRRLRRWLPFLALLALPGCAAVDVGVAACALVLPAAAWLAVRWAR